MIRPDRRILWIGLAVVVPLLWFALSVLVTDLLLYYFAGLTGVDQ